MVCFSANFRDICLYFLYLYRKRQRMLIFISSFRIKNPFFGLEIQTSHFPVILEKLMVRETFLPALREMRKKQ